MGEIYRILFKASDDEVGEKKSSLILKIAPKNPFRRKMIPLRKIFLREIHMYDVVSQRYSKVLYLRTYLVYAGHSIRRKQKIHF